MNTIKKSNVAGRFYSADKQELLHMLKNYLANKECRNENILKGIKGIIAPHAGHIFSGDIAGSAYAYLQQVAAQFPKIAILAPSHYFSFDSIAILCCEQYETPLGKIKIDQDATAELIKKGLVLPIEEVFEQEHALEVHIPFIQKCAPKSTLIPCIVGQSSLESVEKLIAELVSQNIFIIISTDLSHFLPYEEAKIIDQKTIDLIENCDYQKMTGHRACGHYPLTGLLSWAKKNQTKIQTLDVRNSGDTAGDRTKVVGYASFAIYSSEKTSAVKE